MTIPTANQTNAFLGQINEKTKTPEKSMLIVTVIIALTGGFFSLNQLTNLRDHFDNDHCAIHVKTSDHAPKENS